MKRGEEMDSTTVYRSVKDIAQKVKFLRMLEGLNIRELAEALKLHRERITNMEVGINKAELQDVIRYCEYFGLDYEGFLFDEFDKFKAGCEADNAKSSKVIMQYVKK